MEVVWLELCIREINLLGFIWMEYNGVMFQVGRDLGGDCNGLGRENEILGQDRDFGNGKEGMM